MEAPDGEGSWATAVTHELINSVATAGFNTIRIPIAWDSHADQSILELTPAWLARVIHDGVRNRLVMMPNSGHYLEHHCARGLRFTFV